MNETRIGFFPRLYYSITSFDKYRLFLRQSTSKAVVYLIVVTLLLSIAVYTDMYINFSKEIDRVGDYISNNIPDFTLSNGILEVRGNMPIVIESDELPIVIDTTPGAEDIILSQYDTVMLITSDKIIQKNYVNRSDLPLSMYQGVVLTRDSILHTIPIMNPILVLCLVIAAIFFVIGKFISAFFISLIGRAVNSAKGTHLSPRSVFKISVYSMTLPLIVCSVLNLLHLRIPYLWVLFYIGSVIYVFGVISRIRSEIDAVSSGGSFADGVDSFGAGAFGNDMVRGKDYDKQPDSRENTNDTDYTGEPGETAEPGEPHDTNTPDKPHEPDKLDKSEEPDDR